MLLRCHHPACIDTPSFLVQNHHTTRITVCASTWVKREYQPVCEYFYLSQARLSTRMRILLPESSEIINPHANPSTWIKWDYQPVCEYFYLVELKKCFFKGGCSGCGGIFWFSDWHKIVILFGILHVVQMKRSSACRVIVEVLVLGLLVVVYKIPYSSCMIYHVRTYLSPHYSHHSMYIRPVTICNGIQNMWYARIQHNGHSIEVDSVLFVVRVLVCAPRSW